MVIVCDMLDLTVSLDTFDHNINMIGVLDTKQNFEVLNNFSVWSPRSALNHLHSSKPYMRSAADGFLSRSEILAVLRSSMSRSGLTVDVTLIEDLCQTLDRISNSLPLLLKGKIYSL